MRKSRNIEIQIDQEEPQYRGSSHPVLTAFFVLIVLGVLAAAVWFFGYSQWGFSWSGNTARQMVDSPEDVVTSYPRISINLQEPTLVLEPGKQVRLKPLMQKEHKASQVDMKDVHLAWKSHNPSVASVDSKGRVTAIQPGVATISVTVSNDDIDANAAHCLVTVRQWDTVQPSDSTLVPLEGSGVQETEY